MNKKNAIISLGGGCLIATELKVFYLRKYSLPFDWLWNFEDGLFSVIKIIESDFKDMINSDYVYSRNHFMFPDAEVTVFKKYPNISLIHAKPLDFDVDKQALIRRADRFKAILNSNNPITFIYYREYTKWFPLDKSVEAAEQRFQEYIIESKEFVEMIRKKFNRNNFVLLSLFRVPDSYLEDIKKKNSDFFNQKQTDENIIYDFITYQDNVLPEDAEFQKNIDRQFGEILLKYKLISRWYLLVIKVVIKAKLLIKSLWFINPFLSKKVNFN